MHMYSAVAKMKKNTEKIEIQTRKKFEKKKQVDMNSKISSEQAHRGGRHCCTVKKTKKNASADRVRGLEVVKRPTKQTNHLTQYKPAQQYDILTLLT